MKTNDVADARLTIKTPAGASAALAIGARRQLDPRLVGEVAGALRSAPADAHVVIAPFLGARTRERLAEEGIGYVDLVGNMRLVLDRPTVFISSRGDERSPWAVPRSSRSLHAPKACRIVRALADGDGAPFGVRQLAAAVGTDPGYVSRLLDLFHREELIEREPRGPILAVHLAPPASGAGPRTTASPRRTGSSRSCTRTASRARSRACATPDPARADGARRRGGAVGTALPGIGRRLRRQPGARRGDPGRRADDRPAAARTCC